MRTALLIIFAPFLATFAPLALFSQPELPELTRLKFEPLRLDREDPARRTVGRMTYLAGWTITSNDRRFGGISAMHVEAGKVMAISDSGSVIRFDVPSSSRSIADIGPLAGPGAPGNKVDHDSEAMVVHKNKLWVSYESRDEVWRYSREGLVPQASASPPAMKDWPYNLGGEAMLRLPDGRFLLFSEGKTASAGTTEALLFDGDPAVEGTKAARLGYRPPPGYRITDAALLPDGRLLYLNRRFSFTDGISAKLTVGPPPRAGAVLEGAEIAHLEPPLVVDNMEALSITRENGRTILWLASDDNFNPLQRTLLLKFAFAD